MLELVNESYELKFRTIGDIDDVIRSSTKALKEYEYDEFSKNHFDAVEAARVSIGLNDSEIGKDHSRYFVNNFKKYNDMIKHVMETS